MNCRSSLLLLSVPIRLIVEVFLSHEPSKGIDIVKLYKGILALTGLATVASTVMVAPVSAAPTPAPAACTPQPGVDAKNIKMGVIMPRTGPLAPFYIGFDAGVQLRIDQENAKGGIYGRKIITAPYDDQSNGQLQPSVGTKAIDSDGNFGIVIASGAETMFPAMKAAGVPIIGPANTNPFGTDRNAFGASGAPAFTVTATATADKMKQLGATKVAVINGVSASSNSSGNAAWASLPVAGLQQTLRIADAPPTTFDATSIALRLKQAGVDGIYFTSVTETGISVLQALKNQNIQMKAITLPGASDPVVVKQLGNLLDGVVTSTTTTPLTVKKPAIRTFVSAMTARKVNPYAFFPSAGYVSGDLLVKGLKAAGKCPTRASFIDATRKITKFDGAGLLPAPIGFTPGLTPNGDPAKCTWFVQVKNGAPVADAGPTCGKLIDVKTGAVVG